MANQVVFKILLICMFYLASVGISESNAWFVQAHRDLQPVPDASLDRREILDHYVFYLAAPVDGKGISGPLLLPSHESFVPADRIPSSIPITFFNYRSDSAIESLDLAVVARIRMRRLLKDYQDLIQEAGKRVQWRKNGEKGNKERSDRPPETGSPELLGQKEAVRQRYDSITRRTSPGLLPMVNDKAVQASGLSSNVGRVMPVIIAGQPWSMNGKSSGEISGDRLSGTDSQRDSMVSTRVGSLHPGTQDRQEMTGVIAFLVKVIEYWKDHKMEVVFYCVVICLACWLVRMRFRS